MTTYAPGDEVTLRHFTGSCSAIVLLDEGGTHVRVRAGGQSRTVPREKLRPRNPDPITTTGTITRPFSHSRVEGRGQPKETVWRSKAYLAHARETGRLWGCPGCGSTEQIEAAHDGSDGGMGLKASDVYATGQCHRCHRHRHDTGVFPGLTMQETGDAIRRAQIATMAAWIRKGGER